MAKKYITLDVLDDLNKDIFNKIVAKPHKILCKNFDTEEQLVKQLDTMFSQKNYFWRDKSNKWIYYILEDDVFDYSLEVDLDKKTKDLFGSNYNDMSKLSDIQRVELLKDKKNILKRLELIKSKNRDEISDAIVSGTEDTLLLNKVIFDDLKNLSPANAKEKSKEAVAETTEIVKIASNLLSEYSGDVSIFSNIIEKSNGSTVKHMTRVFLLSLDFFQYYNHLINEVGYASNIRIKFNSRYKGFYERLLLDVDYDEITLEKVFKGGIKVIPENEKSAISVGFLLHDIGKQVDIEYFEGSGEYDKNRIQAHVTQGFNELLKRTVYPPVVSAIAGFHHEYYGSKAGYGAFRELMKNKFGGKSSFDYCIAYSLHEVYNGEAYSFFPAKINEIVDVYDALTDPGRKYRDPLSPSSAIKFMEEHFLKEEVKVDPILFDMFKLYLANGGVVE